MVPRGKSHVFVQDGGRGKEIGLKDLQEVPAELVTTIISVNKVNPTIMFGPNSRVSLPDFCVMYARHIYFRLLLSSVLVSHIYFWFGEAGVPFSPPPFSDGLEAGEGALNQGFPHPPNSILSVLLSSWAKSLACWEFPLCFPTSF